MPGDQKAVYGLEDHLRSFQDRGSGFDILLGSWAVEKQQYEKRLKAVPQAYSHYSMHDGSHSGCIVSSIELFLGRERIEQLSATDTWLLLQCAYTHDIGMVRSAKDTVSLLSDTEESDFLQLKRSIQMYGYEAAQAYKDIEPLILYYRNKQKPAPTSMLEKLKDSDDTLAMESDASQIEQMFAGDWAKWPMRFVESFSILSEAIARTRHHNDSQQKLSAEAENMTYDGAISIRLRLLIAQIAYLHGTERRKLLEQLPSQTVGACRDYAHPRFVAALIRIGDLLDLDANRFNKHQLAVIGNSSYASFAHQIKHAAIRHLLINPKRIEVRADFELKRIQELVEKVGYEALIGEAPDHKDDFLLDQNEQESKRSMRIRELCMRGCKELRSWLNMLHEELNFLSEHWQNFVPDGLPGACAQLTESTITIDGIPLDEDILGLRYSINTRRAAEIIEGSGLYHEPGAVFLRELIQNALDYTKIQLFRDIERGAYPQLYDPMRQKPDALMEIKPFDLLKQIHSVRDKYRVEVCCDEVPNGGYSATHVRISVRDHGIGINYEQLKQMRHIGNMYNPKLKEEIDRMPHWLRPTGNFGVGMQSLFYLVQYFTVESCACDEMENGKHLHRQMRFYSSKIGGEIYVDMMDPQKADTFGFGTSVQLELPCSKAQIARIAKLGTPGDLDPFQSVAKSLKKLVFDYCKRICAPLCIPVYYRKKNKLKPLIRRPINYFFGDAIFSLPKKEVIGVSSGCPTNPFKPLKFTNKPKICGGGSTTKTSAGSSNAGKTKECPVAKCGIHGFSIWNQDLGLLIRYRYPSLPAQSYDYKQRMAIYFKGILLKDDMLLKMVHIPFFEIDVHLMGKDAKDYLQINRDEILDEKRPVVAQMIRMSHLCWLSTLIDPDILAMHQPLMLQINKGGSEHPNEFFLHTMRYNRMVAMLHAEKHDKNGVADLKSVEPSSFSSTIDCVPYGEYRTNMFIPVMIKSDIDSPCDTVAQSNIESIWFCDPSVLRGSAMNLSRSGYVASAFPGLPADPPLFVYGDQFWGFEELAINRAFSVKASQRDESFLIYQFGARNGGPIVMAKVDYWQIVLSIVHKEWSSKLHSGRRLIFPGHESHLALCVDRLDDGFITRDNAKYNSWIIFPLTHLEMRRLKNQADPDKRNQYIEAWTKDADRSRLIEYIIENTSLRHDPKRCAPLLKEEIVKHYIDLIKKILELMG